MMVVASKMKFSHQFDRKFLKGKNFIQKLSSRGLPPFLVLLVTNERIIHPWMKFAREKFELIFLTFGMNVLRMYFVFLQNDMDISLPND